MTRSDQVRDLLNMGLTSKEVADTVGTTTAFVRAVRNRDRNKVLHGTTEYVAERARRRERHQIDADYRHRRNESAKRYYYRVKSERGATQ